MKREGYFGCPDESGESQDGLSVSKTHHTRRSRRRWWVSLSLNSPCERNAPYSLFSMFQKIGVAGPSSTPVSDLRQALGARYWPSGT